ncbi:hypothetical protein ILUMI_26993 [Ignelater luminosus]|uniref:Succinate dehydrogenase cytochrome b560 subunit, mitochondrial n=1 Tax=Ignelater luminosus TaxID=2038154 RepID=A0A8K0C8T9_IGNLU|nr:hypothetical protein ILUMI_26993 [Ignelater luminosus]
MLYLCRSLVIKSAFRISYIKRPEIYALIRHVNIQSSPYRPPPKESHDEKNMRIGRPQSPHLSIYASELTSVLSASHRITGTAVAGYFILFSFASLVLPQPVPCYIEALETIAIPSGPLAIAKFIIAFPFCYHFCNGIRHLLWDLGLFLTIKAVYATGYTMLLCAFSGATVLALL